MPESVSECIHAFKLAAWRWLRDRLGEIAMNVAWRVERLERDERDLAHATEWQP